jgi:hypothetical protein
MGGHWSAVNAAIQTGHRGCPAVPPWPASWPPAGVSGTARPWPPLTVRQIQRWADAHRKRTGTWPHHHAELGAITGSNAEPWLGVDSALRAGARGFPGGSSLARVRAEHRGVRNTPDLPPLTPSYCLAWADFHERTGRWPRQKDWREPIPAPDGGTWGNVNQAVALALRGLPGGSSLFDRLAAPRARNGGNLPPLAEDQNLASADSYFATRGEWPTCRCPDQTVLGSGGERWFNLDQALRKGLRC